MAYTYHISFNNVNWYEFYPMTRNKVAWQTEAGEMFMRPKIDEIKIDGRRNNIDPDFVWNTIVTNFSDPSTFGDYIYFKLKRDTVDTFFFIASINDGKLDDQNEIFYITPRPNDAYEKILTQYDREFNWAGFDSISVPFLNNNNFIPEVGLSWWGAVGTASWVNDTADEKKAWAAVNAAANIDSWIVVIIRDLNTTGENFYLSITNSDGSVTYAAAQEITGNGKYAFELTNPLVANMYVQFSQTPTGIGESGTFEYEIYYPVLYSISTTLRSRIDTLLGAAFMNTGLTAKSTILWNDALPSVKPPNIDTYITANPTKDYVIENAQIWNVLVIGRTAGLVPKSDVVSASLNDVLGILKTKLRMFWYIDSDGFFRIEHEKYFNDFTPQIDLTSATYTKFKPEVDRQTYAFEKSDIYSQIRYQESNEDTAEWLDNVTNYDTTKTTPNIINITPPQLSTDVGYIINNTDAAASGLFLAHCLPDVNAPFIDFTESELTAGLWIMNGALSWSWLRRNYYGYFAEADEDDDSITYDAVKRFKKQGGIKFYHDGILTWIRPVTLAGGVGWIEKMELELTTGYYTLDVGFDPY